MSYVRTHTCGELTAKDIGSHVRLSGWVNKRRDLGGLIFVDVRDRYGMTQVCFSPEADKELLEMAGKLRSEYVITVEGIVGPRPEGQANKNMKTGEIEITADRLEILNESKPLPFNLDQDNLDENLRMKYRYLDLRRPEMASRLTLRHKTVKAVRDYFDNNGFLEIETPSLVNSTPEGARDYLVPSRVHPGKVYALPQSPQLFKQILMISGMDRYFQMARCYRDEDLRADRQPEFTQIDLEMSFVERDDILGLIEGMIQHVFSRVLDTEIPAPFKRMTWHQAMDIYGSDKPDLRFPMDIKDVSESFAGVEFKVFESALAEGGRIRCIVVPEAGKSSRKELDGIIEKGKECGLAGVVALPLKDGEAKGVLTKYMDADRLAAFIKEIGAGENDLVLFAAGKAREISVALGKLRLHLAAKFNMVPSEKFCFLWVVDFPLFSIDSETGRIVAEHHPFTSPVPEDADIMESDPLNVRSNAYDLVLNGVELGSGSIRIHDRAMQERLFKIIGLTNEQANEKFGYLMTAFEYGAPPHGGIALGADRLTALMAGQESIREVLAFPKNHQAICPLTSAPVVPSEEQLRILKIKTVAEEK